MRDTLSVSIESPQSGWMSLRLRAGEQQSFVAVMSHAPHDSLAALMRALTALLNNLSTTATVRWNAEPEEFDFAFCASGEDKFELQITRFPDHRRETSTSDVVFSFDGSLRASCLTFGRELRSLRARSETDVFTQNWRRAFPEKELSEFTSALDTHAKVTSTQTDISA